jgi:hypothetical protein
MAPQLSFANTWRTFLIEIEFARNYPLAYQLDGGAAVRNPVLEKVLPSLLYVKMAALLNEAFESYLDAANTVLPNGYRSTLDGRISFFSDRGRVPDGAALHAVRQRRNAIAHEVTSSVSWNELDLDLTVVHSALERLGLVGPRPHFEISAEKSEAKSSSDPGISLHFDYAMTVVENGKIAGKITWRENLHDDMAG